MVDKKNLLQKNQSRFFLRSVICPDVVLYRSLSNQEIWPFYGKLKTNKKNNNKEESKQKARKNKESETFADYFFWLEFPRDRGSYRGALSFGPAREGRFRSDRDRSAFGQVGGRESGERESLAAVSRGRGRFKNGRR